MLWRHGQTVYNAQRRFQGQTDIPLNEIGRQQAASAARYLAALGPDTIFASDLMRATETAGALARLTGLSVKLDEDLRERHGGQWEGLTDTEIRAQFPEAYQAWVPPGGETATQVADRGAAALERIAEAMPGGSLSVVVGHGANLGMGMARLLGIADGVRMLGPFGNCRWSVLGRRNGQWRLMEHNVGSLPVPVPDPEDSRDADPYAEPAEGAEVGPAEVAESGPAAAAEGRRAE
ncbi:MAG TPA: histidine phosphatase family protein [Streptosporangiaceae bacterium]